MTPCSIFRRCWLKLTTHLYRAKDGGRNRVEIASIELILDRSRRVAVDRLTAIGGKSVAAKPAAKSAA
jgi:hypothetical protein